MNNDTNKTDGCNQIQIFSIISFRTKKGYLKLQQ